MSSEMDRLPQAFERIWQLNPSSRNGSSLKSLLSEVAKLDDLPGKVSSTTLNLKKNLLAPLAEIIIAQEEEKERAVEEEQRVLSVMQTLQEERDRAIRSFEEEVEQQQMANMFTDTLVRDLEYMTKAIDQSRQEARQAKCLVKEKEAELRQLIDWKEDLLKKVLTDGPQAVLDWVRKESEVQGLGFHHTFEKRWLGWAQVPDSKTSKSASMEDMPSDMLTEAKEDCPSDTDKVLQQLKAQQLKSLLTVTDERKSHGFVGMILLIVFQEGVASCRLVLDKGVLSVPMAWFCFWMRLSSRLMHHVGRGVVCKVSHCLEMLWTASDSTQMLWTARNSTQWNEHVPMIWETGGRY